MTDGYEITSFVPPKPVIARTAAELQATVFAHPTMSEAVKEAGLAVSKSAIHAL